MKKVTYTEAQIQTVMSLLDGLATTGVENATRIAVISQTLDAGIIEEKEYDPVNWRNKPNSQTPIKYNQRPHIDISVKKVNRKTAQLETERKKVKSNGVPK